LFSCLAKKSRAMRAACSPVIVAATQVTNNQAPEFLISHFSFLASNAANRSGEQAYVREGKAIASASGSEVGPAKRIRQGYRLPPKRQISGATVSTFRTCGSALLLYPLFRLFFLLHESSAGPSLRRRSGRWLFHFLPIVQQHVPSSFFC
jgi:hypothetical protein